MPESCEMTTQARFPLAELTMTSFHYPSTRVVETGLGINRAELHHRHFIRS